MSATEQETALLTEAQILQAPATDYMNPELLAFFKQLLTDLHKTTSERIQETRQRMQHPPEINDESDQASWEEECYLSLRILDREQKLLPKIIQSLERIRLGTYGYCLDSDEPIGVRRLIARPTAEYCTDIKTDLEFKERAFRD